jgi:hypothetical protein
MKVVTEALDRLFCRASEAGGVDFIKWDQVDFDPQIFADQFR